MNIIHVRNFNGFRYIDFHIPEKHKEKLYIALELGPLYGLDVSCGEKLRHRSRILFPHVRQKTSNLKIKVS